nr:hypothetical protein [Chloroflexia bacterium]
MDISRVEIEPIDFPSPAAPYQRDDTDLETIRQRLATLSSALTGATIDGTELDLEEEPGTLADVAVIAPSDSELLSQVDEELDLPADAVDAAWSEALAISTVNYDSGGISVDDPVRLYLREIGRV